MARPRFQEARFHVDSGPEALFTRVRQKHSSNRQLRLNATHLAARAIERDAPIKQLAKFDSKEWQLLTVSVRTDTGKFVSSGWFRSLNGQAWMVVIGLHDTIQTVYPLYGDKSGPKVIREGPLYDFVARVNAELLALDALEQSSTGLAHPSHAGDGGGNSDGNGS